MAQPNQLICPNSGEACEFAQYCGNAKEAFDAGEEFGVFKVEHLLADSVRQANKASFCADERIAALGAVEADPASSAKEVHQASKRADDITNARLFFIGDTVTGQV